MLERVLLPLDGSALADRITTHLGGLLARSGEVTLLGVVPARLLPAEYPVGENPLTLARKHLGDKRDELARAGIAARARLEVGDDAAAKILDFARAHATTLIAMSTHGRTGAQRLLRGSVAERVLRHSTVPVLLANPLALAANEEIRFRKILIPYDGSERAAEVIPRVLELAKVHGSEVILTYSIPLVVAMEPFTAPGPVMTTADADALLARAHERFYDVPVRRIVTEGDPATRILELVDREKVDLVAMTTHGRSGVGRWLFGSVAEQVTRHATCPLLVVRNVVPVSPSAAETAETSSTAR